MNLKHNPFPFIFAQGDETTKLACLEFFGLVDSPQARGCLLRLVKQQRADGAFPSPLDPEEWGMRETVRDALLLLKVGLPPAGVNVQAAVQSVLNQQRPDGGWCENPALAIPPEQTWLSTARSIIWVTADAVDLLRRVGWGERQECQAALALLRAMQNEYGGWPSLAGGTDDEQPGTGDPDVTAQVAFLLGEVYGEENLAYRRGQALFERHLDECVRDVERGYWIRVRDGVKEDLDVYTLTHLLLSWLLDPPRRFQAGYDARDPRVRRMMETLIAIQWEDGGWRPFFAKDSSPVYTVLAVKVLVLSGLLTQEDLEPNVRAHAA